MHDSQHIDTETKVGDVSTPSSVVNQVGDLRRLTRLLLQEGYGSCSDCQKAWTRLSNGYAELAIWTLDMTVRHALHSATTTVEDGTNLHPTFQRIVNSW